MLHKIKLNITILIPLLLVLSTIGMGLFVHTQQISSANDRIRKEALTQLKLDITRLQNILYNLLTETSNNLEEARLNMSVTAMDSSIKTLILTDGDDTVLISNRYIWEGKHASNISQFDIVTANTVKEGNSPKVFFDESNDSALKGYYPVVLQLESENNLPIKRLGILYAEISIAGKLSNAKKSATNLSLTLIFAFLTVSLFIGMLLHVLVSRRLTKLITASNSLAAGNLEASAQVGGNDELTVMGSTFNNMAERIKQDIHRREEAENKLRNLNETLEHRVEQRTIELEKKKQELLDSQARAHHSNKMAALGEMAGGIAHEINSPLQTVTTMTYLMKSRIAKSNFEGLPESIDKIDNAIFKASKIIESLRNMSRDSSDDELVKVSIKEIISDAVGITKERYSLVGIQLDIIYDNNCENALVCCQRLRISQIVVNLLNNAYDAVVDLEEKWISLEVRESERTIFLSVTDSGKGITPDLRDRIFEPMFTTKEVGKGTGLGLSISAEIANANNGKLELNPDSSHTQFVLSLPKSTDS